MQRRLLRRLRTRSGAGDTICEANQSLPRFNPEFISLLADNSDRSPQWNSRSTEPTAAQINVPVFIAGAWQDEQTGGRFPSLLDDLANAPILRANLYNGLTRFGTELALAAVFGSSVELGPNRFEGRSFAASLAAYEDEPSIRMLFEVGAQRPRFPRPAGRPVSTRGRSPQP